MQLSGQTPLLRAKQLEKYLNVPNIYLKLEGSNPTGHKNDRIAEALIKLALSKGYERIFINGSKRYLESLIYFASLKEMTIFIPQDKMTKSLLAIQANLNGVVVKGTKSKSTEDKYEQYAKENQLFYLTEWERKPFIRELAIQKIMREILYKIEAPKTIWTQKITGATVRALYHETVRGWVDGEVDVMPKFYCGDTETALNHFDLDDEIPSLSTCVMTKEQCNHASKLIRTLEHVNLSTDEAHALAYFFEMAKTLNDELIQGPHVIILNNGKSDIEVQAVNTLPESEIEAFVAMTRRFLEPYNDSIEETKDAIMNALQKGFVLEASRKGEIHGICIIVNLGFEAFIPTYHLAYIGVKKGNAGRGVATELINAAIDKTNGKLSLHVDRPNQRAKKLYEKMGFVHYYDRMLYKGH